MALIIPIENLPKPTKRAEYDRVFGEIERLCQCQEPGGRLPSHTALMLDLRASERTVLRALDELQQSGRIIRRSGAGTFVAAPPPQSLETGIVNSSTVVAITQPDHSFFSRCTELLYRHTDIAGLTLLCRLVDGNTPSLSVPPPGTDGPLGFIVFRNDLAPLARRIQEGGHRVVLIGAPPTDVAPGVPCIHGDHEQGAYLATHHLIGLGHRRLAFAMTSDTRRQSSRWLGHQQAIREANRGGAKLSDTTLPVETIEEWEQDPVRATAYFQASDAPTGLVVWNDHEAVRLATVLTRAGVKVPEQVSLVGYDNLPEGRLIYPQLTTVDQAIGQQLRLALKLLTQPTPPAPSHMVLVTPTLVPRGSSDAPR